MKIKVKKPFGIIVGSHTQNLGGTGIRVLNIGDIVDAQEPTTWTSNVWITTANGERGKIECGSVENLFKDGRAEKVEV
jgi:hypothetical protein